MGNTKSGRRNFIKKTTMAAAVIPFSLPAGNFKMEKDIPPNGKKRYALVGTGTRGSSSWAKPLIANYGQHAELVALCDINRKRMSYAKEYIGSKAPTYHASEFEKMIHETKPDTVIVTTTDCFHEKYIVRAMEMGCDVISEKPLVTEAGQALNVIEAEERSGKKVTTTFNARFGNDSEEIKRMLLSGELGKVLSAEYHEYLDTDHGASLLQKMARQKKIFGQFIGT